jgi:branched-chain amino acid transport system substrate-binding protein
MKRSWIAAATASVALLAPAVHADNVKIGVVQALAGPPVIVDFSESYLQGIEAALEEYKAHNPKHSVDMVVYNDEANPQRAVQLTQRLLSNDRVTLMIGTTNAASVVALTPLMQQAQVPILVGPATASDITARFIQQKPSYIFRCSMVEQYMTDALLDWATSRFKKIGLIHTTSGYGMFALAEIQKGMAKRHAQLVAVESGAPNVTDMTPQVLKLKEAGIDLLLEYHDSGELVFRAMQKLDFRPAVAAAWGLSSSVTGKIIGKQALEGAVMPQALDLSEPRAKAFDERMTRKLGEKYRWPLVAALGYDTMRLGLAAVDVGGADPAKVRDALEKIDSFAGVSGVPAHPFSPTGHECLGPQQVFMGVWRDGRVVRLKD